MVRIDWLKYDTWLCGAAEVMTCQNIYGATPTATELSYRIGREPFHILSRSVQFGEEKSCQIIKLFKTIRSGHRNGRKSIMSQNVMLYGI